MSLVTPGNQVLSFLATIAPLQSAITIAADGGARIKLDIPETEMTNIQRILALRNRVLAVSIVVLDSDENSNVDN
jgi:hypothetical protein